MNFWISNVRIWFGDIFMLSRKTKHSVFVCYLNHLCVQSKFLKKTESSVFCNHAIGRTFVQIHCGAMTFFISIILIWLRRYFCQPESQIIFFFFIEYSYWRASGICWGLNVVVNWPNRWAYRKDIKSFINANSEKLKSIESICSRKITPFKSKI